MPYYLQKEIAPHASLRCGVKFALVPSGLTLQILSNGQPEILQSSVTKKRRGYLDHTGIEACPYHQMDHGVRL